MGGDVLVLGAGVVGIATAYALARRGLAVTIVDRAEEPARGTSFANGGQLSYAYTDALGSPGLLRSLPLLALAADPAFRMRPSLDPDFIRWGLAFLRNCTAGRFRENTLEGLRIGFESRAALHDLLARHPLDFGHARTGKLHLLEGRDALAAGRRMVALKNGAGVDQEIVTPAEAVGIEPALAARAASLSGAIYSPEEEVGDPFRFCAEMLRLLQSEYGVRSRFGAPIERLEVGSQRTIVHMPRGERLEASTVAVCTGVDTPALLRGTGVRAPIWPMKGYSITAPPGEEAPRVSVTDVARRVVFCRLSGVIRIAGLADLGARDTQVHPRRLQSLVSAARAALPAAADYSAIQSRWSGLRPMTPNSLPIIRRGPGGLVLNVGHGTLGWTFAMGAGERAANLALGNAA
jgi:D-amino-acid dehydrogenase